MTLRTMFAALLLGLCLPLQAATEVIPLNYRTADDVPVSYTHLTLPTKA